MEPNHLKLTDEGESLEFPDPISQGVAQGAAAEAVVGDTNPSGLSPFRYNRTALVVAIIAVVLIGFIAGAAFWVLSRTTPNQTAKSSQDNKGEYEVSDLEVGDVQTTDQLKVGTADNLAINGQLQVSKGLVLTPMNAPSVPTTGQLYFDSANKQPYYYNGTQFVSLTPGATGVTSLQGSSGAVALVAGTGVAINGLNITNTGVTALTGANGLTVSQTTGNVTLSLPQDLSTGGSPTFAGLAVSSSVAIGKATAGQTLDVNGSIGFSGNLVGNSFVPQAGVAYSFANAAAGSYNICTTAQNCVGIGGGVTTPGGTTNRLAKFTGAQTVGDSLISDDGTTVTVGGSVLSQNTVDSVTAFQIQNASGSSNLFVADTSNTRIGIGATPATSLLTIGTNTITAAGGITFGTDTSLYRLGADILQTGGSFSLASGSSGGFAKNYTNGSGGTLSANTAVVFNGSGQVTTTTTPRDANIAGVTVYSFGSGVPGAVAISGNAQVTADTGAVAIGDQLVTSSTSGQVTVDNNATTGILGRALTSKSAGSSGIVTVAVRPVSGQYTPRFQNATDSITAFQIQNAAGTSNLLNADTINNRIGILTAGPNYPLDVNGDINTGGSYRINGVQICVASGCIPAPGSSSYIQNGTVVQGANFNIQSAAANQVGGVIQGAVGQTSDLLQLKNSSDTNLIAVSASGTITLSADTNLYRSAANTLKTDDAFQAGTLIVSDGAGLFSSDSSGTAIAKDGVAALRVYDTGGSNITFDVNTISNMVGIGTTAATSLLTVGTDTTVASGGITFGTDTNLYRNGDDYLKTDGSFESQALVVNGHADLNTISADGAASFQNAANSTNAFQIQNAAGTTTLLRADTTNGVIKIGTIGSATQAGSALFVTAGEFSGALRVGDGTNRVQIDGTTKRVQYVGTARQDRRITIDPEYPGAVLTADGSNNTGTMTSDFCSGSSRLSINASICGATDEFNYYSWIGSGGTMDYDVYVRWQVPTDFSAFQDANAIKMYAWRGTASEKVELAMFQADGTQCGSTTEINSSNTTWQQTNLTGDETACSVSANDIVTFRIKMTASASGYARASNLQINYLSQF